MCHRRIAARSAVAGIALLPAALFLFGTAGCSRTSANAVKPPPPPVHVSEAKRAHWAPTVTATAELRPRRSARLAVATAGRVAGIERAVGDRVEAGDALLRLEPGQHEDAAAGASASVEHAEAGVDRARQELARAEQLVAQGAASRRTLEEARDAHRMAEAVLRGARAERRAAKRGVWEAVLRAPFPGTVVARTVEVGEFLGPGAPAIQLVDEAELRAEVLLAPRLALEVAVDTPVKIHAYARPDQPFEGTVVRIARQVDPETRRIPVEVRVEDPEDLLRPGLLARFEIAWSAPRDVVTIDPRAQLERFGESYVLVVEDGIAHRRRVQIGTIQDGAAEVVEGLRTGEQVVVAGHGRVVDGEPVRVVDPAQPATPTPSPQPGTAEAP